MQKKSKDKFKEKSFKRYLLSFKYSFDGLRYAFYHEKNLFLLIIFGILELLLGIVLNVSYTERLIIVVLIGATLCIELLNTAIEASVNLITREKKEDAKHAKDAASGAVAVFSIFHLIIVLIIFIPKIILLFRWYLCMKSY